MLDFAQARRNMVDCQLRTFDVTDRAVLAAMGEVPREAFMPEGRDGLAYLDTPTSVDLDGVERTMLAPMVLARMLQALRIESGSKLLDVAGSYGYSAAVAATLGAAVTAVDTQPFVDEAKRRLSGLGLTATFKAGSPKAGCPDGAPFDTILVNGAVDGRPEGLLKQLGDGGRLVCIQREGRSGRAVLFVRSGGGQGHRALFDAVAPVVPEFLVEPGFVF